MKTQLAVKVRRNPWMAELPRETVELITLGQDRSWKPEYMGLAPVPYRPVRMGDWLVTRAVLDSTPLPEHARQRVQDVYTAGLRPKDWLIAHEICQQLKAPDPTAPVLEQRFGKVADRWRTTMTSVKQAAGEAAPMVWTVTKTVAVATAGIAAVSVVGLVTLFGMALLTAAASIDPLLIAVMDSGGNPDGDHWILIDRWDLPA